MFAEELSASSSRKRQEEARARRRQIKQQQQKKAAAAAAQKQTPSTTEPTAASSQKDSSSGTSVAPASTATVPKTTSTSTVAASQKTSSAVANALEQRQLRQEAQKRQRAALTIQSTYRAHTSNCALLDKERSVLKQRLTDLCTLRTLLQKTGNGSEYVPPPATATSLVRQIVFVTRAIPYKRNVDDVRLRGKDDVDHLDQVLQIVLLPGLMAKDDNSDPILPWFSTADGRIRFLRLLRLCLVTGTSRAVTPNVLSSVNTFLRVILGIPSADRNNPRQDIVRLCRHVLIPVSRPAPTQNAPSSIDSTSKKHKKSLPHSVVGTSLDIIQILRTHLLFQTGGSPIPPDADKMRESCISGKDRANADVLFQLTLDAVQTASVGSDRSKLQSRFVTEILSVPLLTWKVSAVSISKLLASTRSNVGARKSLSSRPKVLLIDMLSSFVDAHAAILSAGEVASILPNVDVPLTACPATNVQCLLANLIQVGRICPSINGSDVNQLDYQAGALFFKVLATLIDVVPIGTFSSRHSAVEWISDGKSHHTPIILSPVVIDQCKLLLVDSYVRDLFTSAIDDDALGTDRVLRTKNDKDVKHEKDLTEAGGSSAATLAAKEARVDRNKSFWQSSKWARKLSKSVSKMLSGDGNSGEKKPTTDQTGPGMLVNTSSISRKLAHGKDPHDRDVTKAYLASQEASSKGKSLDAETRLVAEYSPVFFFALCRTYGTILARWGGGGKDDIVKRAAGKDSTDDEKGDAMTSADPCTLALLNVICFSTGIVRTTWSIIQSDKAVVSDLYSIIDTDKRNAPIRSLKIRPTYSRTTDKDQTGGNIGGVLLYMFVCSFSHVLIITDDCEIHDMDKPLPIHQVRRCIQLLKKLIFRACCVDDTSPAESGQKSNYFGLSLISSSSRTMRELYDRSSRRPLCVPKLWLVEDLLEKDLRRCRNHGSFVALLSSPVLRVCPFLVSFKRRLKLFERMVTTCRLEIQGCNEQHSLKPGIPVRIMRARVLEDGLLTLNKLGPNLRQRIVVQYLNEAGARESGVDVGGLFKEFWTDLSALAFDLNMGLFRVTEGAGNCLYPNPSSAAAHGSDHIILFEFLGRILGKALFEGITIQPQFAHFFLSFLRGDYNYLHMLPDLSTMDPQLYNNLMFLKTYDGDATDLCLTFTVADDDFGGNREVPLIPNGGDIEVTNANKLRYIGLVAKHHVCDRLREQSEAFTRGLWDVIDRKWLRLFNEPELQVLISGASDGKIDVEDMRSNTRYAGGYSPLDRNVHRFWNVVASMSSQQQACLLRFVTSCERPPPLGFQTMNPPFTIQRVGILRDGDKLPTASTCFNTLKLPTYSSERVLRERLLYSIESGAGFELT